MPELSDDYEPIRTVIDKLTFGISMMNGPENLHFLSFIHKIKEPAIIELFDKKIGTSENEEDKEIQVNENQNND